MRSSPRQLISPKSCNTLSPHEPKQTARQPTSALDAVAGVTAHRRNSHRSRSQIRHRRTFCCPEGRRWLGDRLDGKWKRHDGKPDDNASSDGYGTGFAIYGLPEAGLPADDPRIQSGIAWLKANQRSSGRWFTRSQWKDSRHYLRRLGTLCTVRALVFCGER